MSEFWCEQGWKPAPPKPLYAMCKLGKWDRTIPNCVRPGCDKLEAPWPLKLTYEMDEAIARFKCSKPWPEVELVGESVLSCDGQYWNSTIPTCQKPPPVTTKPTKDRHSSWDNDSDISSAMTQNIECRIKILCAVVFCIYIYHFQDTFSNGVTLS